MLHLFLFYLHRAEWPSVTKHDFVGVMLQHLPAGAKLLMLNSWYAKEGKQGKGVNKEDYSRNKEAI